MGFASKKGPVINVRDDNHRYSVEQRGLAPLTSFYESVDPADPKKKTKDWFEFTPKVTPEEKGALMFAVAVMHPGFYSLITTNPGADPASIGKERQPTILTVEEWEPWLMGSDDLFKPSPAGMFTVTPKVFPKVTKS
jgi:putative SOS response-associated peptidase YedK